MMNSGEQTAGSDRDCSRAGMAMADFSLVGARLRRTLELHRGPDSVDSISHTMQLVALLDES
jgi:hypothetical protein